MRIVGMCLVAGLVLATGCDQKPGTPSAIPSPAGTPTTVRPTTQEIVNTPRRAIQLGTMPLRLTVPITWAILAEGKVTFLSGFTPGGKAYIQLVRPDYGPTAIAGAGSAGALTAQRIEDQAKLLKEEAGRDPQKFRHVQLRKAGASFILERQIVEPPIPAGFDEKGAPTPELPAQINWTVTVYTPRRTGFVGHVLRMNLPLPQYEMDRAFLEHIFETLEYDGSLVPLDDSPPDR